MAKFDEVFAELQAKVGAVIAVIAADPALAAQVKAAIDSAEAAAVVEEQRAADDARANAISQLISGAGQMLAAVAPTPEPEPEAES